MSVDDTRSTPIIHVGIPAVAVIVLILIGTFSHFPPRDSELELWLKESDIKLEQRMGLDGFTRLGHPVSKVDINKFKLAIEVTEVRIVYVSDGCAGYEYWIIPKQITNTIFLYYIEQEIA